MHLLEAFAELDLLNEGIYEGTYKSNYLNLSDAERKAAEKEYLDKRSTPLMLRGDQWVPYRKPRYPWENGGKLPPLPEYILDIDAFHKAYDKDMAELGLLKMFESDGKLKAKGSYGNLMELKAADPSATKHPGYKAAMNLWARMFSDSTWENGKKVDLSLWRWHWMYPEDAEKKAQEARDEMARREQARLDAEKEREERAKAQAAKEQRADELLSVLADLLEKALPLIDPALLQKYTDYAEDDIIIEGEKDFNLLVIPRIGRYKYTNEVVEQLTEQELADAISEILSKQDFAQLQVEKELELEDLLDASTSLRRSYAVYFGDPDTKQYRIVSIHTGKVTAVSDGNGNMSNLTDIQGWVPIMVITGDQQYDDNARHDRISSSYYSYSEDEVAYFKLSGKLPDDESGIMWYSEAKYYDKYPGGPHYVQLSNFDAWAVGVTTHIATD